MKVNTLAVDPIMLQDELWMRQHEKPVPKPPKSVFNSWTWKSSFRFLNFEVGSVQFGFLETDIRHFHPVPHTPNRQVKQKNESLCVYVCVCIESQWVGWNPQDKTEYAGRSEAVRERDAAGLVSPGLLHAIAQFSLSLCAVMICRDWLLRLTAARDGLIEMRWLVSI